MKKNLRLVLFLAFLTSSTALSYRTRPKKRSPLRAASYLNIVPAGHFTFNVPGDDLSRGTGAGIGAYQSLTYRLHENFSFGIASNVVFFLKSNGDLSNSPGREERSPISIELLIPLRGHLPISETIELQGFVDTGLQLMGMPGAGKLGLGPAISPGLGVEIKLPKTERDISINIDLAWTHSWVSLESALTSRISLKSMGYFQIRTGISYLF